MAKIPAYLLNLAGEYRVCSELNKRGVFATVTYGTRKGVDVYAISDRKTRALKIEVKTSQKKNFVTSLSQKCDDDPNSDGFWERRAADEQAPDFWVLFQIRPIANSSFAERFFVLTHKEICNAQCTRNSAYGQKYLSNHGKMPDFSTGVDNVVIADIERYEDQWDKIVAAIGGPALA
ncbi:MAG TPA: hypothetical protein VH370_27860 [Humisphaera sp.]|jgi:hypothetical protein|nr:hypothetical protein [Humisphaera sp.]